jgi:DNA primase
MNDYIVDILSDFLGDPKKHNQGKGQVSFDCPSCAMDKNVESDDKGNLEVNYQRGIFKCWACANKNNMRGTITKLIYKHGNKNHLKQYNLVKPDFVNEEGEKVVHVAEKLPEGFLKLIPSNEYANDFKDAMRYLTKRGITQEIINKYNIGFVNKGKFANRIIIPSYDSEGALNYFIGRAFYKWVKPKYLNSDAPKDEIIFNESIVEPNATIYLVEGTFDSIVLPNSIPLLGLFLSDKLFWFLQSKARANVVIVLDGEASAEADALYKRLNVLNLYNRVKIIRLREELDMSLIYQKYGNKGLQAVLKMEGIIKEIDY